MKLNPMQIMNTRLPIMVLTAKLTAWLESAAPVPDAYIIAALRIFDIRQDTRDPNDESELVVWNKVPSEIYGTWSYLPYYGDINIGPRLYAERGLGFPGGLK